VKHPVHRRALIEAAIEVHTMGLSPGTSGNLSIRVPRGFLITPSGLPFETLDPKDAVLLDSRGRHGGDRLRASSEYPLHAAIYSDRPEASAIVHLHSPYATAIACLREDIPAFHYMVARAGGDSIRCARYETYGTEELALAAVEALDDRTACLLANHGQVAIGSSIREAVRLARDVEDLAQTWSIVLEAGEPSILHPEEMDRVKRRFTCYGQDGSADPTRGTAVTGGRPAPDRRPTLRTERLILRPFHPDDAPAVRRLAGTREVADNTLTIPHPYPPGEAERWIATHAPAHENGELVIFAITTDADGLVGAVGLKLTGDAGIAELGYWIGVPYWGHGYATEAAREVVRYGFERLALQRIQARAFSRNPASTRVLQKIGMRHEGFLRKGLRKNDELLDTELYGILRDDPYPNGA
jgi:L-fuculose-phosphate aldolase